MFCNSRCRSWYRLFTVTLLALLVCAGSPLQAQGGRSRRLFGVTFSIPNSFGLGGPAPMSGPEPAATAALPLFGAANVWNNLPATFGVLTRNPSWSNLVDSKGRTTRVRFRVVGTVLPVNLFPYGPDLYVGNTLRSQFIAWNSWNGPIPGAAGPGESTTIRWTIEGLQPNHRYSMFFYGAVTNTARSFDMTIQGRTKNVPTYLYGAPMGSGGAYFANLWSDGLGRIRGQGIGVGDDSTAENEANWVGFQLVEQN
jgi:hypothetical protein